MIKKIDNNLQFYFVNNFPSQKKVYSFNKKLFFATISIGANIGNCINRFKTLFQVLNRHSLIKIISTSPILKNPPFGFLKQNYFYNAVINIATSLDLRAFFKYTKNLEKRFQRVKSFKNAPRTLDIDIIFFDNLNYVSKDLVVPHYDWKNRVSVVLPMSRMRVF
ncbi:MAG: 2-amino-4-hydroxy-6-hydroxymethyldihydropteridine diphosphokinase [Campylobacterales bacterium]|nr:2-amino-4-hydroxy-6-hydroxymethyldihydropteridine diphosphokinase [Campylobacterales bacterium]